MKELKKFFQELSKKFKLGSDNELKELKKIEIQLKKLKNKDQVEDNNT
jgi:hypothetical protein